MYHGATSILLSSTLEYLERKRNNNWGSTIFQESTAHLLFPRQQDAVVKGNLHLQRQLEEFRCCVLCLGRAPVSGREGQRAT